MFIIRKDEFLKINFTIRNEILSEIYILNVGSAHEFQFGKSDINFILVNVLTSSLLIQCDLKSHFKRSIHIFVLQLTNFIEIRSILKIVC